uniref:Uncharacterized protein n=1 Tax=Lepeophtheirus salmonis TaxID=72036 RepID=A0A0K2TMQ7_LEPSM
MIVLINVQVETIYFFYIDKGLSSEL